MTEHQVNLQKTWTGIQPLGRLPPKNLDWNFHNRTSPIELVETGIYSLTPVEKTQALAVSKGR